MNNPLAVRPYVPDAVDESRRAAWLGKVSCAEFHRVRNALLATLRPFGSVGPMGEFSLEDDCEPLRAGDPGLGSEALDPVFFIVDDQYNGTARWHRVETELNAMTRELLYAVATMLRQHAGWEVYFAVGTGALVLSGDVIGFDGPAFAGSHDLEDIVVRCAPVQ